MKEFCKRYMVAILLGVFLASVALCIVAVETTQYVPGDVNHDGAVDSADVITLRRYLNGDRDLEYQEIALDISNDGTVDETDIDLLRQAIVAGFGVELKPNMPEVPPVEPEEPFDNTQMVARLRMVSGDIKDNELNFVMEESAMMMYTIKVCIDDIKSFTELNCHFICK